MSPRNENAHNVSEVEPDSFGAQLRHYREAAGLTQSDLGAAIGSDQKRISAYERNLHMPGEEIMVALAEVLHIPAALLFERTKFGGVIPVSPQRRERLMTVHERDWRLFDQTLDKLGEITPEQRATFEKGFRDFLDRWHE